MEITLKNKIIGILEKALLMFMAVYVVLFGMETILPGLISEVFNINFIFFAFFMALFLLLAASGLTENDKQTKQARLSWLLIVILGYMAAIFFLALYRISLLEAAFYFVLAVLSLRGFYFLLK